MNRISKHDQGGVQHSQKGLAKYTPSLFIFVNETILRCHLGRSAERRGDCVTFKEVPLDGKTARVEGQSGASP